MNLNQVNLIGRVTADPELKSLPSGVSVASFSLATNRVWKDKDGQKQEDVQFHNVVAFGRQAEILEDYVTKGMLLYVSGRLQTRNWEDKDSGKKMYRTEVVLENLQLPPKSLSGGDSEERSSRPARKSKADEEYDAMGGDESEGKTPAKKKARATVEGDEDINVDDIPF